MWGRAWDDSIGKRLREVGYEDWHAEMHEREIDEVVATKKPIRGEVSFPHATLGRRMYDYILINNSLKFANKGRQPVIVITSHTVSVEGVDYVSIEIADNGIGFERDYNKKIFETFTRLNSKDKYEGTGLGLSLCKKIMERHQGRSRQPQ